MKKVLGFMLVIIAACAYGEEIQVQGDDGTGISFEYTVPKYSIGTIRVHGKDYQYIDINKMALLHEIGMPSLPVKYLHIAVPLHAKHVQISVQKVRKQSLQNIRIIPAFYLSMDSTVIEENRNVYESKETFPGKNFEVLYDGMLMHQRIMKIALYPFQFNPYKNEVYTCSAMKVSIRFVDNKGEKGGSRFLGIATERRLKHLLLNYTASRSWREVVGGSHETFQNYEPWHRIHVVEDGLYALGYNYLKNNGINPENIDPRTIKVYNGGSAVLDADTSNVPAEYDSIPYQVPVYVHGEEDGSFDQDDYLLFYGLSLTGWDRCSVASDVPLYYNPFTDENVYWLTWGGSEGKRMDTIDGAPSSNTPHVASCFKETIHIEENRLCPSNSGFGWVWEEMILPSNVGSISRDYTFSVEQLYTDSFQIRVAVYGATTSTHVLEVQMNGIPLCDTSWYGENETEPFLFICGGTNLVSGDNTIRLRLHKSGGGDDIYVDYLEVSFYRNLRVVNNEIVFSTKDGIPEDTVLEFSLYGFSEQAFVCEITNPFEARQIIGASYAYGTITFQSYVPVGEKKHYIAAGAFRTPEALVERNPFSLRGMHKADYLIITHKKFYHAALQLRDWRRNHLLGVQNPVVRMVLIDEIFDNFGWGLADPVAIRNFLFYAANFWVYPPGYVVLFGGGSYDYKNQYESPLPKNYIPVYEKGDYVHFQELMRRNPCYEDFFTDFTGDLLCDIPLGRITVVTEEEAAATVNKIMSYESGNLGVWKNKVILIADDEFDSKGIDGLFRYHVAGTEAISSLVPDRFDQVKEYLSEYPGTNPGSVPPGTKPEARKALIKTLTSGGLLSIFLGHGNLRRLAHETVFYRSDISMLENEYRGPFCYFGSCSVGDFDRPDEESIADLLQKKEKRGAIASLACTRTSGYSGITVLGRELATNLLKNADITIGDGVLISKQNAYFGRTYAYFGDPATPLFPDSIGFQATISSDTLVGGKRIDIQGQTDDPDFNGFLYVSAFDSEKRIKHPVPTTSETLRYTLPGSSIFQGVFTIEQGEINASFFVPADLDSGVSGRVSLYIWDNGREGRKSFDSLLTGYNDTLSTDTLPPAIEIYYHGKLLSNGMTIPNNAEIKGILEDESGIDISERDERGIYIAVNEDYTNIKKLNDYFFYDINSSTRGSFSYGFDLDTSVVSAKLEISCYDNNKNQAIKILNLNIYNGEQFTLSTVYNFPNPFEESTNFTFTISHRSLVKLSIFTVTGKTIFQKEFVFDAGFNSIYWDGRDGDGDRIANGVYFYKLKARAAGNQDYSGIEGVAEYRGKIAIAR